MSNLQTKADEVRWTLQDLHEDVTAVEDSLEGVHQEAEAFAEKYRGRIADLSAPELAEAIDHLAAIRDRIGRAYAFAYLSWSTKTNDPDRGAFLQSVRETTSRIKQTLVFVEVEWAHVSDERADELLAHEAMEPYRHYLEVEHLQKKYVLSEPEEKILSEKQITGKEAWTRYFDETIGSTRFELNEEELTQEEVLTKLYDPNRRLRQQAALAFTEGLKERRQTLTFVFNTLLADKASTDRLRGYDHWLQERNLANEIDDETVEILIETVTDRYDLVARFYDLKRELLGLDELYDYDRYAPVDETDTTYDWDEARDVVLSAYEEFHPTMAATARRFFEEDWIDAAVVPGKRSGAFSHGTVPSAHPYVLLNYTGKARDVQTLAHELGHGVHQFLAREQSIFHHTTPLTTAEMASVFGEMLVFRRLMRREDSALNRLAMIVSKVNDILATVFRQTAMNRFEHRIHTDRREEGELRTERFAEHWMATQEDMFQGSVTLGDHYRHWWSYIPHFLHTPGYVYAYSFGELLVLALFGRYQSGDDAFADTYLDVLRAGGSEWPNRLLGRLDVDLDAEDFWERGLAQIEDLIEQAEDLAERTGASSSPGRAPEVEEASERRS